MISSYISAPHILEDYSGQDEVLVQVQVQDYDEDEDEEKGEDFSWGLC